MLLAGYVAVLIYGSLFPLRDWRSPPAAPLHLMLAPGFHSAYTDILTNLLVYVPLGFLLQYVRRIRRSAVAAAVFAALFGLLLSFGVEYVQAYLPSRVPSILDTLLNTTGTFAGALLAASLWRASRPQAWLVSAREAYFVSGRTANAGLAALGVWALSQLSPWVPSIDIGSLRQGLHLLRIELEGQMPLDLAQAWVYALSCSALGLMMATLVRSRGSTLRFYVLGVGAVLCLKVPVVGRQLSLEALIGLAAGFAVLLLARRVPDRAAARLAGAALVAAIIVDESRAGAGALHAFNWIPFRAQLTNNLVGFEDILEVAWYYAALSYLAAYGRRLSRPVAIVGTLAVFLAVFALEWRQQSIPGRYGDVTDALVAAVGWLVPSLYLSGDRVRLRPLGRSAVG